MYLIETLYLLQFVMVDNIYSHLQHCNNTAQDTVQIAGVLRALYCVPARPLS